MGKTHELSLGESLASKALAKTSIASHQAVRGSGINFHMWTTGQDPGSKSFQMLEKRQCKTVTQREGEQDELWDGPGIQPGGTFRTVLWVRETPSSGYTEWAKQRLELGRQRKLKFVGQSTERRELCRGRAPEIWRGRSPWKLSCVCIGWIKMGNKELLRSWTVPRARVGRPWLIGCSREIETPERRKALP